MSTYEEIQEELDELLFSDSKSKDELLQEKKDVLVSMCKKFELASYGTKEDLADRLVDYFEEEEPDVLSATSNIVAIKVEKDESGQAERV